MSENHQKHRQLVICSSLTFIFAIIIVMLSLIPLNQSGAFSGHGIDKIFHLIAFGCLVFPLSLTQPKWTITIIFGVVVFGGSIEMIQKIFGRQASWADLLANTIGSIIGALAALKLENRVKKWWPK